MSVGDDAEVLRWAAEHAEFAGIRELADVVLARMVEDKEAYDMQVVTSILIAPRKERDHIVDKFHFGRVHPGWLKPLPPAEDDDKEVNDEGK